MNRMVFYMSLNEKFKKEINVSKTVINPILETLYKSIVSEKAEAFFTNAQYISNLEPLKFSFGFCFFNFFNVIFNYFEDSLHWTAYSCKKTESVISDNVSYKSNEYENMISNIEKTLKPLIPQKYFNVLNTENYSSYTKRFDYINISKDEFKKLKNETENENFKTTDEYLEFMKKKITELFGDNAENFKTIDNYDYHGWHINFSFEAYKTFTVKIIHEMTDGAQIIIGDLEHCFNIPMSADSFGKLTADEFLAQLKENLELRLEM